jgi:hypothetical protein
MDSTYKDNNKKLPLLEITATTNEMNTFLVAQALLPEESGELLLWIFKEVCTHEIHLINRSIKRFLITDGSRHQWS